MKLQKLALVAAFLLATSAQAASVSFSFLDDPSVDFFGRPHAGVTVTGILYFLENDGSNRIPTSIEFTSDVSFVGITDVVINAVDSNFVPAGGGFTLTSGCITAADFNLNFDDPATGGKQLRLNSAGNFMNVLMWNGGSGPFVASGNADGFSGATYCATVPEPGTSTLVLAGMLLIGGAARRHNACAVAGAAA